jgi:hypothetical protein
MSGSLREEAFTLGEGALEVELWRDPAWSPDSTGDASRYGRVVSLSEPHRQAVGIEVRVGGRAVSTALVLGEMGCPGISSSDAVLRGDTLVLAMAARVAALALPSLEPRWQIDTDDACIIGLMEVPGEDDLLVHGELYVTRLAMDGAVRWQRSGFDIFTGGCVVRDGVVTAVDWNGAEYRWRLSDGELLGTTPAG